MRKKTSKIWTIPKNDLQKLCYQSFSIRELLTKLGYRPNSGQMFYFLKERIEKDNIDIHHFTGKDGIKRMPLSEIMVKESLFNRTHLKERIIEENIIPYKCAICKNNGYWMGKKLSLQLEHKNGIPTDHRKENLEFLCPNCHSQTKTFSGKNAAK